jgi:hypothetical protein
MSTESSAPPATTKLQIGSPKPHRKRKVIRDEVPAEKAAAAEQERQEAFEAEYLWDVWDERRNEFVPTALHPYTSGREALFYRLRLADGALSLSKTLSDVPSFLGDAIKILYLCSHTPEQWRALRTNTTQFLEEIDAWGDVNVPRAKQVKATLLALNIFNHAGATQAVPEPAEGGDSGN